MNNLESREFECSGCFLCADICPAEVINIQRDHERFYKYNINEAKCISCGLCIKKCPQINNKTDNETPEQCYSAYSKDEEILQRSSSGGIFSELAKVILSDGGLVVGAAWENGDVRHIFIHSPEQLTKLRGSKYLQSSLSGVYKRIKEELEAGKKVLFTGLPCQVCALNNYVKSDNLFTIDIVCHGAPSRKTFDKSLKDRFNKKEIKKVDFRNKENGWQNYKICYYFGNGQIKSRKHREDDWFLKYIHNDYLNTSCYQCHFSNIPRTADITLGDFWGIASADREFLDQNMDKGVSVVIINSAKGQNLFDSIVDNIVYKEQILAEACRHNPRINQGKYEATHKQRREEFFNAYDENKKIFDDDDYLIKSYKRFRRFAGKVKRKLFDQEFNK